LATSIGGRNGTLAALGFAALMNFGAFFWSDKIVLSMYRAKPVDPSSAPELHAIVSKLAMKAGIPMPPPLRHPGRGTQRVRHGSQPVPRGRRGDRGGSCAP
jgi:Zn-dependent protease with chaperone function